MKRASILLVLLGACSSEDPCDGVSGPCIGLTPESSLAEVQTALIEVKPGGTVAFGKGTFFFDVDLSLDVDGVTIRGAGQNETILSFERQMTGAQGMLVTVATGCLFNSLLLGFTGGLFFGYFMALCFAGLPETRADGVAMQTAASPEAMESAGTPLARAASV